MKNAHDEDEDQEITSEQIRNARPIEEIHPGWSTARVVVRRRGPGRKPAKQLFSLRVAPDVVAAYRGTGRGWQGRISKLLAAHAPKTKRAGR